MIHNLFYWISGGLLITFDLAGFVIKRYYIKEQATVNKLKRIRKYGWILGVAIGVCAN